MHVSVLEIRYFCLGMISSCFELFVSVKVKEQCVSVPKLCVALGKSSSFFGYGVLLF